MSNQIPQNIGLIGLGAMGAGMASSLRRAGYNVHVYDIRPEAVSAFTADGGVACDSAESVADACPIVISVLVNADQTEQLLFGAGGMAARMQPDSTFVMCSTVDPNWSVNLEQRLEAMGIGYLDAPISGGAAKAASGEMTMMTAGKPAVYARLNGVLEAMAAKVYRLGDQAGNGLEAGVVRFVVHRGKHAGLAGFEFAGGDADAREAEVEAEQGAAAGQCGGRRRVRHARRPR